MSWGDWPLWQQVFAVTLVGAGAMMGLLLAFITIMFLPPLLVLRPLRSGRYATAARLSSMLTWAPGARIFHGAVLIHADRLNDAEAVLRECIDNGGTGKVTLAYAKLYAGAPDEAAQLISQALQDSDEPQYRGVLALCQLFQGRCTPATLNHVNTAIGGGDEAEADEGGAIFRWLDPNGPAERQATKGWAAAALDQPQLARECLDKSLDLVQDFSAHDAAHVHWIVAHAYKALGDVDLYRLHLERGRSLDPNGVVGRVCTEAL